MEFLSTINMESIISFYEMGVTYALLVTSIIGVIDAFCGKYYTPEEAVASIVVCIGSWITLVCIVIRCIQDIINERF